jgi:AraC-like DNA-binding protein
MSFHCTIVNCGISHVPPSWRVNEAGSLFHRVYFLYGGNVIYKCSDQEVRLRHNHIYVFPSRTSYQLMQNPKDRLICLWFEVLVSPDFKNPLIEFNPAKHVEVLHIMKALDHLVQNKINPSSTQTQLIATALSLIHHHHPFTSYGDPRIVQAVKAIEQSHGIGMTVARLAESAGLTQEHFSRQFKKEMGFPPRTFIIDSKINYATELMRSGALVREAAFQSGFEDEKDFSKIFKKYRGLSPRDFKQGLRNLP